MLHLYWFNLKQKIRCVSEMFWSLAFPLILGTFFWLTFGTEDVQLQNPVDTALVSEGNFYFEEFLYSLDGEVLTLQSMDEEKALEALADGAVEGIFYSSEIPSLTVAGVQINESVLEMLLDSYIQNQALVMDLAKDNPLKLLTMTESMDFDHDFVESISLGGNSLAGNLNYFFALIGMSCMFGSFMGMTSAMNLRADRSSLAARRCVVPTNRLTLVVSEMLAAFTAQFINICIVLLYMHSVLGISFGEKWILILPVCALGSMAGVAVGICVGSLPLPEGAKMGMLVGGSLVLGFLSGLMFGNMKNIVEQYCPIVNRLNPSALISDAFYSISVYENMQRYGTDLAFLALITIVLMMTAFLRLRREKYDSI